MTEDVAAARRRNRDRALLRGGGATEGAGRRLDTFSTVESYQFDTGLQMFLNDADSYYIATGGNSETFNCEDFSDMVHPDESSNTCDSPYYETETCACTDTTISGYTFTATNDTWDTTYDILVVNKDDSYFGEFGFESNTLGINFYVETGTLSFTQENVRGVSFDLYSFYQGSTDQDITLSVYGDDDTLLGTVSAISSHNTVTIVSNDAISYITIVADNSGAELIGNLCFGSIHRAHYIVDVEVNGGSCIMDGTNTLTIPVSIMGSDLVDVTTLDRNHLRFSGIQANIASCVVSDVNSDGVDDLTCNFITNGPTLPDNENTDILTGRFVGSGGPAGATSPHIYGTASATLCVS